MRSILILLLIGLPAMATEHLNFINLRLDHGDGMLKVGVETEQIMSYDVLRDKRYFALRKDLFDYVLDASFRQTVFLMRTLDRNRGAIGATSSMPIISFTFELAVREITGEELALDEYKVILGVEPESDKGFIAVEGANVKHVFNMSTLTQDEHYRDYLTKLVLPFGERQLNVPNRDQYLVDLYFNWPRNEFDRDDLSLIDLFPSAILWDQGPIRKQKIHLGSTYAYKSDGEWNHSKSAFYRNYGDSIQAYETILALSDAGERETLIENLEEYVQTTPSDTKALKMLMDAYVDSGMNDEAYDLITRFEPFFATIREGLTNARGIAADAARERNQLLGRRARFTRDDTVKLNITSPEANDLVTGTVDLTFEIQGAEAEILTVECFFDEQRIAEFTQPPFRTPFTTDGSRGVKRIRVKAYFENETYQETEIRVRTLKVDEEQEVNLVALQAVVFQSERSAGKALAAEDFEVTENREEITINNFRKSEAPLRLAIVIDTSISMVGDKMHRTQYAVNSFLSKLEPEDRASIYTFDSRVLRISDFTNEFDRVTPDLMTLSPLGGTSLYDAMMIAHDALIGQNGTKVMIVISDGDDSASTVTDIHVARMLRSSPVMVYSIILPEGYLGDPNRRGVRFLTEMANLTGSVSTKARDVKKMDENFDRILYDLRNLYYFDYYSDLPRNMRRDIRLKVKQSGSRTRFRIIN